MRIAVSIYSHLLGGLCEQKFHCHRLLNRVEIHLNQCDGLTNTLIEVLGALLGVWGIIPFFGA